MNYRIFPPEEILETTVARLPLSKSVAARAMVLASLTASPTAIDPDRIPDCDDIRVLAAALALRTGTADMGASATAARFMTAFYAATAGTDITVDGCERLRRRPIGPLVDALRRLQPEVKFGIGGVLTFKKSPLPDIVPKIGVNHILLETDAPWLAPVPMRGKQNESAYVPYIAAKLAETLALTVDEVDAHTSASAREFFRLGS